MTPHQLYLILRARWIVLCSIFGVVFFGILILSLLLTKQYTSTASVVVDAKTDPVAGANSPAELLPTYLTTEVDIISSQRVAEQVIKMTKLDQDPGFRQGWLKDTGGRGSLVAWGANILLSKKLAVVPGRESNVIDISVKWPDAKFAAVLANSFAKAAIDTNIELKVEPAKQYATWFAERSKVLRADLEAKQKRLSDFQNSVGVIIPSDDRLDVENQRLNQLSQELVTIQSLRQDSQSRQRQVGADVESLPEVIQSPLIASLKADLAAAEAKRADIANRLGKNHPDYQAADAEVASARSRIAKESADIAASLGTATQVNVRRENEVRAALAAQTKRVLDLRQIHDQASMYESDVATAQRSLDAVTERLAQSNLQSQVQQTDIVLLTPAEETTEPSSPHIFRNAIIGFLLGALLAIVSVLILETRDRRVRSEEEIRNLLDVPYLGKIDSIPTGPKSPPSQSTQISPA